jgi:hypothetical protein
MFFDELYESLFVVPVLGVARLAAWFERNIIERAFDRLANLVHRQTSIDRSQSRPTAADEQPLSHIEPKARHT